MEEMDLKQEYSSHKLGDEAERIRRIYSEREERGLESLYAWYRPEVLYSVFKLRKAIAQRLHINGRDDLRFMKILDLGCGRGDFLSSFLEWGISENHLYGIDLLEDRIQNARTRLPTAHFQTGDGQSMPYKDNEFDLIFANTVFSSIPSLEVRTQIACEMRRVLSSRGIIYLFDLHVNNPWNANLCKLSLVEVSRLFKGASIHRTRLILVPPILRVIYPKAPWLVEFFEALLPLLRVHSLYEIQFET